VRTGSVNVSVQGIYTVRYNVTDGSGNAAQEYIMRVFVRDITAPQIRLLGQPQVTVSVFSSFTDLGVVATDESGVPPVITQTPLFVNTNVTGQTIIRYTATDASGNSASVDRTVNVVDNVAPVITLVGPRVLTVMRGQWYAEIDPGYFVSDNYDAPGDITLVIDSMNYNKELDGVYFIYYNAIDRAGNRSEQMFREVRLTPLTGISEMASANSIQVYPNPTTGVLKIAGITNMQAKVQVFDMLGKLVHEQQLDAHSSSINVRGIDAGVYYISVIDGDKLKSTKITIVK
jgi:hypothetical protein